MRTKKRTPDGVRFFYSLIEVNASAIAIVSVIFVYQSLIEVNARTTDCVLKTLYPQPLVKSSELFMNKKQKYKSIS